VGQPDFDAKYVDAFAKEEMRKIAVESIMSSAGQYGVLVMAAVPFMPAPLKEFFEGPTDPEILNLQAQVDCLDGQLEALWAEMKATISREIGGLDDKIASDMAELNLISSISMITELSAVIEAEFIRPLSWCSQVVETGDGPATWAISDQTGACTDKSHYVGLSSLGTRLVTTTVSLRVKMKGAIDGLESIRRTISENQNKKDASREFHWGQLIESHRPAASFNNWPEPHVFLDRDDSPGAIGTDFTVARKLVRDFVALAEQALTAMKLLRATMSSRTVTAADELQHFEQLLRVNTERPLYQEVVDMLTYLKQTLNGIDRNGDDVALGRELRSDRFRPKMMCVDPTLAEEALLVDRASGTGGDFQRPGWCSGSAAAKNDRVYSMDRCPDYAKNCSNPANSAIRPKGAAVGDSCITPCATHPRVHGARWCFTDYQAGTDLDFEVLLSTSETSSIGVGNDIESRVSWGWCGPAKSTRIDSPAKGETQGSHNFATRWISQGKDISLFQCPMATGQDNWYQERLDEYCDSCIDWSRIEMSSVWSDYGEPDGVHGFGIENCKSREYSKWCGLNSLPQGVESGTHGECGLLGCPGDYNLALSRNMVWTGRGAAVDPLAIELALLDSALANAEGLLSHTFA